MTFHIVTEPIPHWPGDSTRPGDRQSPRFKASYEDTLRLLDRELDYLAASGPVVLQVVTRNGGSDLRRDGLLRAQAKIEHPGVRLSFKSLRHGDLTYATDQFDRKWSGDMLGWQANLRAIALGLEALRAVDRYGISKTGEQYRGWAAISARSDTGGGLSKEIAEQILRETADPDGEAHNPPVEWLLRTAKANSHPDRNNGDRTRWDAVERAARSLGLDDR